MGMAVGNRTTNLGHNYKIYSGTCVYASRGTCHGMHASGMSISAARGGAAGGSRDMNTERDPQELDTSLVARLPRIVVASS